MALFQRKGPYDLDHAGLERKPPRKPISPETKKTAILLTVNTLAAIAIYFTCAGLGFYSIFLVYFILGVVLLFGYVIYNRGFVLKGATPEMLDDSLSMEEKVARIEDAKQRMKASRWMLTLIIPLLVSIIVDFLYVYVVVDALELLKSVLEGSAA